MAMMTTVRRNLWSHGGIGDTQPLPCLDFDAGDFVPVAKVSQRDAEAIGDCHQRLAPTRGLETHMSRWFGGLSGWNHERFDTLDAIVCLHLIDGSELIDRHTVGAGDRGQRIVGGLHQGNAAAEVR